jgi:hypothetical protein
MAGRARLQDPQWLLKVRDGRTEELMAFERTAFAALGPPPGRSAKQEAVSTAAAKSRESITITVGWIRTGVFPLRLVRQGN